MLSLFSRRWWVIALRGVLAVIFGIMALVWPSITLELLVVVFGVYTLMDGFFLLVVGIGGREHYERWGRIVLSGILSLIAGLMALVWPGLTAIALLLVLAVRLMLSGIVDIIEAVQLRKEIVGEWMMALGGLLSVLLGVLLLILPGSGLLFVVWTIGLYAILFGLLLTGLSLRIKKLHSA